MKYTRKIITAAMSLMLICSSLVNVYAADSIQDIKLDKTATQLNEDDETTVQLRMSGNEEKTYSDVVFVLDKSTSVDVRNEAKKMLDELLVQANKGHIIQVGVVLFNKNATNSTSLALTKLTADNIDRMKKAIDQKLESGTNIYAGLKKGEAMLDADTQTSSNNKHLVLVTDGVTYLWGDGQNENDIMSIYSESAFPGNGVNTQGQILAGNDMMSAHHAGRDYLNMTEAQRKEAAQTYYEEFQNIATWYQTYGESIASDIKQYQHIYQSGAYTSDAGTVYTNSTYQEVGFEEGDYVAVEDLNQHASANDAAVYQAVTAWRDITTKYHGYAYANTKYYDSYVWCRYVENLSQIGGHSEVIPTDVSGIFDSVKSDILYAMKAGSIRDIIGDDFDLKNLSTVTLSVGEKVLKGTIQGNTISFEDQYQIHYQSHDQEQLVLDIQTPLQKGQALELSYVLSLTHKETNAGIYETYTNEKATLAYESSDGTQGEMEFPKPIVSYEVKDEIEITPPHQSTDNQKPENNQESQQTPPTSSVQSQPVQTDDLTVMWPYLVLSLFALLTLGIMFKKKKTL